MTDNEVNALNQKILRVEAEREMKSSALVRAEADVHRLKGERERQSSVLEAMQKLERNLDSRAASNLERVQEKNKRIEIRMGKTGCYLQDKRRTKIKAGNR